MSGERGNSKKRVWRARRPNKSNLASAATSTAPFTSDDQTQPWSQSHGGGALFQRSCKTNGGGQSPLQLHNSKDGQRRHTALARWRSRRRQPTTRAAPTETPLQLTSKPTLARLPTNGTEADPLATTASAGRRGAWPAPLREPDLSKPTPGQPERETTMPSLRCFRTTANPRVETPRGVESGLGQAVVSCCKCSFVQLSCSG